MRGIFTSTFAAIVLGAAIVSSQAQAPDSQTPAGGNTQPSTQTPSANQGRSTSTTYKGYLRKSATGGYPPASGVGSPDAHHRRR
jgi:hypothetical protein